MAHGTPEKKGGKKPSTDRRDASDQDEDPATKKRKGKGARGKRSAPELPHGPPSGVATRENSPDGSSLPISFNEEKLSSLVQNAVAKALEPALEKVFSRILEKKGEAAVTTLGQGDASMPTALAKSTRLARCLSAVLSYDMLYAYSVPHVSRPCSGSQGGRCTLRQKTTIEPCFHREV